MVDGKLIMGLLSNFGKINGLVMIWLKLFKLMRVSMLTRVLASVLNLTMDTSSLMHIFKLCDGAWSLQCKAVIIAVMLNIFNNGWFCMNQLRFNNKIIYLQDVFHRVIWSVCITGNMIAATANASIRDFEVLKYFKVEIHPLKLNMINEIFWHRL